MNAITNGVYTSSTEIVNNPVLVKPTLRLHLRGSVPWGGEHYVALIKDAIEREAATRPIHPRHALYDIYSSIHPSIETMTDSLTEWEFMSFVTWFDRGVFFRVKPCTCQGIDRIEDLFKAGEGAVMQVDLFVMDADALADDTSFYSSCDINGGYHA